MTQPQKSQDRQLVEKQVWNHGKTPSLGGETGGLYLILRPMELSAAERYTTMHRGWAYFQAQPRVHHGRLQCAGPVAWLTPQGVGLRAPLDR